MGAGSTVGFSCCILAVLDRIADDASSWEGEPLSIGLASEGQLAAYQARGLLAADGYASREELPE
jgi:hypothetical protein